MLAYGYKYGEPWAEDEQAFYENRDRRSDDGWRSYRYGSTTLRADSRGSVAGDDAEPPVGAMITVENDTRDNNVSRSQGASSAGDRVTTSDAFQDYVLQHQDHYGPSSSYERNSKGKSRAAVSDRISEHQALSDCPQTSSPCSEWDEEPFHERDSLDSTSSCDDESYIYGYYSYDSDCDDDGSSDYSYSDDEYMDEYMDEYFYSDSDCSCSS
jgi:hypothetical protein